MESLSEIPRLCRAVREDARALRYDSVEIRKLAKDLQGQSARLLKQSMCTRAQLFSVLRREWEHKDDHSHWTRR